MTDTLDPTPHRRAAGDRAVIAVFADLGSARVAVERLAAAGSPTDHVSLLGEGKNEGEGEGKGKGKGKGDSDSDSDSAILVHFVEEQYIPRYEQIVRASGYLVVVHGAEPDVARAQQVLTDAGGSDVQRHDKDRDSAIGPISKVVEGMRVFDAAGKEVGKVEFVKLGDPEAITTLGEETDDGEPRVVGELRARLLRLGFIKVDRKGFFKPDGYAAADEIDRVEEGAVHLAVTDKDMLKEGDG